MPIKTIFLDRDGVINKEINYLHKIEDFEFIDGIFDACLHFQSLSYKIIIITVYRFSSVLLAIFFIDMIWLTKIQTVHFETDFQTLDYILALPYPIID